MRRFSIVSGIVVLFVCVGIAAGKDEPKLTAQDIVTRHLESIGTASARAAAKSRTVQGSLSLSVIVGNTDRADGAMLLVSPDAQRLAMRMQFQGGKFSNEQFVFDGRKAQVGFVAPNQRSEIGQFLYEHEELLREGLFGGTLSTSWSLLDSNSRRAQLKYEGLKQIDNQQMIDVSYLPKKGDGELRIHLYFEPTTYRHLKTVYTFTVPRTLSHNQKVHGDDTYYRVEETFGDFQPVNGLNLPQHWNLRYSSEGSAAKVIEWDMKVGSITHNNVVE